MFTSFGVVVFKILLYCIGIPIFAGFSVMFMYVIASSILAAIAGLFSEKLKTAIEDSATNVGTGLGVLAALGGIASQILTFF